MSGGRIQSKGRGLGKKQQQKALTRGREPQGADLKPMERTGERGGRGLRAERLAQGGTWG